MIYYKLIILNKDDFFPKKYLNDNFYLCGYTDNSILYNISLNYFHKLKITEYLWDYDFLKLKIRRLKLFKLKDKNYKETTEDIILLYIYNNFHQISYSIF
jgi:hypothetical protein